MSKLGPFSENTIVVGDCLDIMAQMPDGCVDLVVTDPPYGIGYKSGWQEAWSGEKRKVDDAFGADILDTSCCGGMAKVLSSGGAIYLLTRWDVINSWAAALDESGITVVQRIVWDKVVWGMGDLRYFGSQAEDILFGRKGDHRLNWKQREGNIWRVWKAEMWNYPGGHSGHPTEKPIGLIQRAVEASSNPGDLIFDPFIGSGTTAVVADRLGRKFFGCDINPDYVEMALERLEKDRAGRQLALL